MTRRFFILIAVLGLLSQANFSLAADQCLTPNDPYYGEQWYLNHLQMCQIWPKANNVKIVVVAVIDSGVELSHPDLHDNIWVNQGEILGDNIDNDHNGYIDDINGWNFIDNDNNPAPTFASECVAAGTCAVDAVDHGTLVSGVIAAIGNNNLGISGMDWQAKIMPLRALDENGLGNTDNVIKAINYAIDKKVDIINLSFVGSTYDPNFEAALNRAYQAGIVVVASAGNEEFQWAFDQGSNSYVQVGHQVNLDTDSRYPVCFLHSGGQHEIIGVGATDKHNLLSQFSNYGSSCIDVMAPGEDFFGTLVYRAGSADFGSLYGGYFSGTSLAAPVVSGLAALIKGANPTMTNRQIIALIENTADNIDALNPQYAGALGHGLIDPTKVFQQIFQLVVGNGLIKASGPTVYYLASNGKRYAFTNSASFKSWYPVLPKITTVTDDALAQIPLDGTITFRPGSLIKVTTVPTVYAVTRGGILHALADEQTAQKFYGANWAYSVNDLSDAFFTYYQLGEAYNSSFSFNPTLESANTSSIDINLGF